MPDLEHSLHSHDLGHLRIIAEGWGLDLTAPDVGTALPELVGLLVDSAIVEDILETLSPEALSAISSLLKKKGRIPWVQFTRQFGEVREIGPGRRDRQRPDKEPTSITEVLWYLAIVSRAFFDTSRGSEEFAYIPDDLLPLISKKTPPQGASPLGRAATAKERAYPIPANDHILDHICTLLAARRINQDIANLPENLPPYLNSLLSIAGILGSEGQPNIDATRAHLEAPRGDALLQLAQAWLNSAAHNDLHLVPGLKIEGEWENDPLTTRRIVIRLLDDLPTNTWWNLSAFIADIRRVHPDFQRPAGDYDSWYIKNTETDKYLRGFEHWDDVEGVLIRYLITGPLHWLGFVELAVSDEDTPLSQGVAFRYSGWASAFFDCTVPEGAPVETDPVHLRSDGRVGVPLGAPRSVRYQIARFCRWEPETPHEYRYLFTPTSLERARQQGLEISHLLAILQNYADSVPPNIAKALKQWEMRGTEIRVEPQVILRVGSPKILQALQKTRAARFLGDPLGPTAIIVKTGAEEKVLAALLEMGFMGEISSSY
ncbi:MAG: helicase-associated domain-containing protein [Anaerolineales bacterium]|nr:helicase-associated domain-containing protein [Chloroflexota bacterium]MBL6981073.1 helicase-associated domain-containing protein [Anaerolineales bacterium]